MVKKRDVAIIVLVILLVLTVGYIGYGFYSNWKQQKDFGQQQEWATQGYEFAVAQLYQGAAPPNCQQVPVTYNNQTINVIDVGCLNTG